ncbi:MAG TPA: ABC transporter permease [Polyangiaceae bacterium]|nr:ABC transporter permease [Polyangiaceae bacterium]
MAATDDVTPEIRPASKQKPHGFSWQLLQNKKAAFGLVIVAVFLVLAVVSPLLVRDPTAFLAVPLEPPSAEYWLGTTGQGQDVFAQTLYGARTSLWVGFSVGVAVIVIGTAVGLSAGYFGGAIDDVLTTLINVFLIMPGLPLAVVLAAYLPAGPLTLAFVLVVTSWSWHARVGRAQTLSLRHKDFVNAAIVGGESHARIMFLEILPNMTSLIVSGFIGATVYAIGAQVGLEFLGLGDVSVVTWGTNLYWAANNQALLTESWWTIVPTGLAIALVGFALAMINFAIDEVTNPRLKAERTWTEALKTAGIAPGLSTPVIRSKDA